MKKEQRILVKYSESFGRGGSLEGLFATTRTQLDAAIGRRLRFGEVLGKHSNVTSTLPIEAFTVVSDDAKTIEIVDGLDVYDGFNPVALLAEQDEEDGEA